MSQARDSMSSVPPTSTLQYVRTEVMMICCEYWGTMLARLDGTRKRKL